MSGSVAHMSEVNDQMAREQYVRDLLEATDCSLNTGDQRATQEALISLGVRRDAISSGEFGLVGSLIGGTLGSVVDAGGSLDHVRLFALGNREILHKFDITNGRRDQLTTFMDFGEQQLQRLCASGTTQAVIAALVSIFTRTLGSIGMAKIDPPV